MSLRKTPVKRQAQPPSRGRSSAVPKIHQQSALKTGIGFQPPLNETDDEAAETEPVAANVRNVRRLACVKPAPEVCQSPKKLQVAQKTSRKNISQKVGRRTGTAAFKGKNIRLLPDGTENFDDYWTDSEAEISLSRESVLKENNSMFIKLSNVPRELSMSPKKLAETVRYSTAPKIGRRTGVAAFEGKQIRLLPDGTENFDDYFTDDRSSKDSYLTDPSQKKSGIPLEESSVITDDEDSDRIMIHKSCDTRGLAVPTSTSESKQLRERSAREETTEPHYVDHESHVSNKGLAKSFASHLKVSQNKGTNLSSSNHQDASADESNSTQEKSDSTKETEMFSRNSHKKNAGLSNTTKSKNKIIVQSINKTRSFKEPENSLSGVLKSKRLSKTFSNSKNTSYASFRNRNVWIEDTMSEDDSNITQSESIISKRKVLDYAEHSASDEADASHLVQPTLKVKKLKKGHGDISGNRLQQSLEQYEAENSVDKVASVEAVQKAPKVKNMHDHSKKHRSRKSVYVGNYGEDSLLDKADAMVSAPKVRKSNDEVSNERLTHGNRGNIPSQEFVEENDANSLPSNNDTNASQMQNNKSKTKKHTDVSSERSINDSAKNNAENLSGEDETGTESQARKLRKSKKNKHDDVASDEPRCKITTAAESIAGNLSDEAEAHLVHKEKKINKSNNVSNKGLSTRNITVTGALVSADGETPSLVSAEDAVEAIQVPKATKLNKKDGNSTDKQRPSISSVDEIDNEADATNVKKSNKKKQKDKLPSTEGVRRRTGIHYVDHESHVSYKELEKTFAPRLKVSQNKGTNLSSSNLQDASADESDSTQENEALFSSKSFRSPRKKPRASRSNKNTNRILEAKENLIGYNDDQHMSSSKETEMPSRNSHQKNAGLSNTTKSKNKIIVQSINKTRSFKEPENSLSGVLKSIRLTKTFSHSKNTSFGSFRNRNVWIEDSMSEDDSNITQPESIISKRKVLDYAEHSASDEADASHSVQPTTKVKKLKKGHNSSGNRLQQSLGQYEAEISVDKMASVEAVQKAPKVKKMHDLSKKLRLRKSGYVGNYGEDSSLDKANGIVSAPKVSKSNDVSNKRLTRGSRGSIPSQEFVEENNANALPSNNDDTNNSQMQNNKSKRKKHTDVSSEHSINDSAKNNAKNLSGEDETGNESQARKVRKSKKNKHDDVTSEGPRRNITTAAESIAGNLSDEAVAHFVHKTSKINKSNKAPSTRNITETGALVSADDETPLVSAGDAVEAIQVPKATKLNKDGKSPDKQIPSISSVDEIDNEADATNIKKSNKKRQKDTLPSTEGVRRGTRIRIPPLETWRGQRQVFKYKFGEGFVYTNISPGRKEDDGCRQAILKRMQQQKEMKLKDKKKGTSRHIPKTTVFDAFREKEVEVHLHRPFDFVEWTAITGAKGRKVPYYLTKTFDSDNVAFGFLEICPLELKASQYSPEDNIHFLVVKGSLKVVIHKSEFMFERLDTFIVPCKEVYSIENVGKTKALLSFCTFKTPFFTHQIIATNQQE